MTSHEVLVGDVRVHYAEHRHGKRAGFDDYVAVRTIATARRYRDATVPGTRLVDGPTLERIFANWTIELGATTFPGPVLIVAGRVDPVAGHADAAVPAVQYPHAELAELAVLDAGHALPHERPDELAELLRRWLGRAGPDTG